MIHRICVHGNSEHAEMQEKIYLLIPPELASCPRGKPWTRERRRLSAQHGYARVRWSISASRQISRES
jgi:hypothetical protein